MHPGNHLWIYKHTRFGGRIEREAEDFTAAFLMDVKEALAAHLTESWEVAEHFGLERHWTMKEAAPLLGVR